MVVRHCAALGFTTLPIEGPAAGLNGLDYADARPSPAAFLCRPGCQDAVTSDRASYFLGVWGPGAATARGAALFPLSMDRYAAMLQAGDLAGQLATETAARNRLQAALHTADAALRGQQQLAADQRNQAQREHAAQLAAVEAALARTAESLRQTETRLEEAGQRGEQDRRLARVQLHALRKENDILTQSVARLQAAATEAQQQSAALEAARREASEHATALAAELAESRAILDRQGDHDALVAAHAALVAERAFLLAERERIFARMRPVWRLAQMIPSPMRRGMRRVAGPVLRRFVPQS
ncbi:hypothetical protein [Dankookia sp. P2]|uniref:hypothetical protein n=1 Tax=Dankookia sp. P2 TaxID=3423955 RepID=UPI003D6669F7